MPCPRVFRLRSKSLWVAAPGGQPCDKMRVDWLPVLSRRTRYGELMISSPSLDSLDPDHPSE